MGQAPSPWCFAPGFCFSGLALLKPLAPTKFATGALAAVGDNAVGVVQCPLFRLWEGVSARPWEWVIRKGTVIPDHFSHSLSWRVSPGPSVAWSLACGEVPDFWLLARRVTCFTVTVPLCLTQVSFRGEDALGGAASLCSAPRLPLLAAP